MLDLDFKELARLDDRQLAQIFRLRRSDPQFLEALNEVLKKRNSDAANDLHIEVVIARRAFPPTPNKDVQAPASGPVREWLRTFFTTRALLRPDGRAMYRYRMADGEYEQAKTILRLLATRGRLAQPDSRAGALFVAYCAEWFRRESGSTFLRWDDLAPDLFPNVPYASKQQLTEFGLRYWKRPLLRSESAREFLLTLALEGGFPVRLLAEDARGWLKEYLRVIMRRTIASRANSFEEIRTVAEEERGRMRKTYRRDDFVALCAELAKTLLDLRRKAEAEGAGGLRNSTLLDVKFPAWRDELPIYIPDEDDALVTELLTGLLDEKMVGLHTEGVEARRYLVKRGNEWLPALQLLADGEIPPAKLPGLTSLSRARAIATGELANHIAGELALLEPPIGEQRRWRVRPYTRTGKLLLNFPFSAPVVTILSSPDGVPHAWTWPRGEPLRSDVLVFEADEGSTKEEPLLRFFRSGSVSSAAKNLYVLVPRDWVVEPAIEGAVTEIVDVPALGRKLAHLTAAAYFRSPGGDEVRFKVEPNSDEREAELELAPLVGAGFVLADASRELVATPAKPMIREPSRPPRSPGSGEIFARQPGDRWTRLLAALNGDGVVELSWRDPIANIQIEKRQIVLVPGHARIEGVMRDSLNGEIRLYGLPGWTASVSDASCVAEVTDTSILSIRFTGKPVYRLPMKLRPPHGPPFDVIVTLIGRDAVVALANGSILPPGRKIDVGSLRGAVAVSPRRTVLHLAPKGAKSGGVKTIVDGELPLGILRSSIDEILATLAGQDDLVELDFIGDTRVPIRINRYRHDQLSRDGESVIWSDLTDSTSAFPVARMILDPRHEYALESAGGPRWRLPGQCKGLCLVYLRDGIDVVSRPLSVPIQSSPYAYSGALISALAIPEYDERQHAIFQALSQLGRNASATDDIRWLRDIVTHLNGLPASAFDALKLLPSNPEALIHLLLNARDASERGAIWSLQNDLPFLWLALPLGAWLSVVARNCTALADTLEGALGAQKAMAEAVAWLRTQRDELTAIEPALEMVFDKTGLTTEHANRPPSLRDLTSIYVRDQHQRGGDSPNDQAARLASVGLPLPPEIVAKSHTDFAGLFAPVLLAASACEKLPLEHDQQLLLRRTLREDPVYVSAAWYHLVEFYGEA